MQKFHCKRLLPCLEIKKRFYPKSVSGTNSIGKQSSNVVVITAITAVIATPMKIANAQQRLSTQTNQSGINVDQRLDIYLATLRTSLPCMR